MIPKNSGKKFFVPKELVRPSRCNLQVASADKLMAPDNPPSKENKIEDPSVLYAGKDYNLSNPKEPKGSLKILGP